MQLPIRTMVAPKGHTLIKIVVYFSLLLRLGFSKMGVCFTKMGVCFMKMGVCFTKLEICFTKMVACFSKMGVCWPKQNGRFQFRSSYRKLRRGYT